MSYPETHDVELHLDNETLATTHDAIVLTVGGVLVQGETVLEKIYFRVNISEQIALERKFSASTFEWWMCQSEQARAALFSPPEVKISTGRAILREAGAKARTVWARPAMFDLPMLRHLFGQDIWDDHPPRFPHHGYQKERDLGTLVNEFDPHRVMAGPFVGEPHNALDDAMHHFKWLTSIRRVLFQRGAYDEQSWSGQRLWSCKIGECGDDRIPQGGDGPLRDAVIDAYKRTTGLDPKFCFSGWGGMLTSSERAVVDASEVEKVRAERGEA